MRVDRGAWNVASSLHGLGTVQNTGLIVAGNAGVLNFAASVRFEAPGVGQIQVQGIGQAWVAGQFVQGLDAVLDLDLDLGDGIADLLKVTGEANLAGTLNLNFPDGYVPDEGAIIPIIEAGYVDGGFDAITYDRSIGRQFTLLHDETSVYLEVSAVPEPGTWATMLVGLGMVGGLARRRMKREGRTIRS